MGLVIRLIIGLIGAGLAYISFRSNYEFWFVSFAANPAYQYIYCALSIAAGALKYSLVIYAEVFQLRFSREKMLGAILAVALVFDLLSGLGYSRMSRDDLSAGAQQTSNTAKAISDEIATATAALARAKSVTTRAVASIDMELAPLNPGTCLPNSRYDRCIRAATLQAERRGAVDRDDAESRLADLHAQLASVPPTKEADPQAGLIADALNFGLHFVGVTVTPDQAKVALALLLVLLLELGPVGCARAAFAVRDGAPRLPRFKFGSAKVSDPQLPGSAAVGIQPAQVAAPAQKARRSRTPDAMLGIFQRAAVDPNAAPKWLKVAPDGWQYFGQQDAAVAHGVSKPTVGRRLAALAAQGVLEVKATNQGTAIKVLYPRLAAVP